MNDSANNSLQIIDSLIHLPPDVDYQDPNEECDDTDLFIRLIDKQLKKVFPHCCNIDENILVASNLFDYIIINKSILDIPRFYDFRNCIRSKLIRMYYDEEWDKAYVYYMRIFDDVIRLGDWDSSDPNSELVI